MVGNEAADHERLTCEPENGEAVKLLAFTTGGFESVKKLDSGLKANDPELVTA